MKNFWELYNLVNKVRLLQIEIDYDNQGKWGACLETYSGKVIFDEQYFDTYFDLIDTLYSELKSYILSDNELIFFKNLIDNE